MSEVTREASQKRAKKRKTSTPVAAKLQQPKADHVHALQNNDALVETAQQDTNIEATPIKIPPPAAVAVASQSYTDNNFRNHFRSKKKTFTRISVDPNRQYSTPESREAWGPNVKGKKFRKEKSKKKRCQGTSGGMRIDGSVKSIRLDA